MSNSPVYFVNQDDEGFPLFWTQQRCEALRRDPTCFEKYCIEWKWTKRRRRPASLLTTWASTTKTGTYAKTWKYEPCELDSKPLNCDIGVWHYSNVDPEYFPLPFCSVNKVCEVKACLKLKQDKIIIAYDSELNILGEGPEPQFLNRRGIADEVFNFASIEGMALTKDKNRLYVVDSLLTKVVLYEINHTNNTLALVTSWGRFGFATDAYGFNKPKDIVLDPLTNKVLITDTGNECLKIYSSVGRHLNTLKLKEFTNNAPLSVCIDSQNYLHVLLTNGTILVINWNGDINFKYKTINGINPNKISASYNREAIYISHNLGIAKHFRTGTFFENIMYKTECANGLVLKNFNGLFQDEMRTLFACVNDKVLKIPDRMKIDIPTTVPLNELYWSLNQLLIHKEEYIQPWVYVKAFHRLWDNIELVRTFLQYNPEKDQRYLNPVYQKEEITIGQNEIVTNSVVNRCINQLWANIETLMLYFE